MIYLTGSGLSDCSVSDNILGPQGVLLVYRYIKMKHKRSYISQIKKVQLSKLRAQIKNDTLPNRHATMITDLVFSNAF